MAKRIYKKITPRLVADHATQQIISGNATAALRDLEPEIVRTDGATRARAVRIVAKSNTVLAGEYIDNALEQIGPEAIDKVRELVQSDDQRIATKNSHFVIEHLRGKAVQRSIALTGKLNIQNVLD